MSRPCVVGTCRCGGQGIVHDEQAEAETGLCHTPIGDAPLSAEDEAYLARARRLSRTLAGCDRWCSWCYSEALVGNREGVGRPLTEEEMDAGGFFPTHPECRDAMDAFFADLASRGVFLEVQS